VVDNVTLKKKRSKRGGVCQVTRFRRQEKNSLWELIVRRTIGEGKCPGFVFHSSSRKNPAQKPKGDGGGWAKGGKKERIRGSKNRRKKATMCKTTNAKLGSLY